MAGIEKCPTGIAGLDEITRGGLPRGRPTLVCGGAGSGKTLLAMEFLVRGAKQFEEPGVFMAFEETGQELASNVSSLGFGVPELIEQKKLLLDYVYIERSELEEAGEYDLEGLFVRLDSMIKDIGAKRVAIDSLEALFSGLPNEGILRAELRRLFRWLKDEGLTAVITAEQGINTLTRHNLEEYISDCVIFLDHRVNNQVATRRLRVVKYRGSAHGTNEYPTMIDAHGLSVLPISSLDLDYDVSADRVPSGVPLLDEMLGGKGYYRGSSILISGTAGTGKTIMGTSFGAAACKRGEKCLYLAFEESFAQLRRNMASVGLDLARWEQEGSLHVHAARATLFGLEQHLGEIHRLVDEIKPTVVVVDPLSTLQPIGSSMEITAMLTRVVDLLKQRGITALFVSVTETARPEMEAGSVISSLMDTLVILRQEERGGDRRRFVQVLKSRGMAHSNRIREYMISDEGVQAVKAGEGAAV